ncbi:MAG: sugar-binding transcriptional regulator [Actinobacteria bacterium]|nr:sugar-binding transcriptional regulator [Actinomycetota bacterium]
MFTPFGCGSGDNRRDYQPSPEPQVDETDLMVRAAWLYYEEGLTQQEVADRLGVTRLRITRLLKEARDQGVVEIRVIHPIAPCVRLEEQLKSRFDLKSATVVPAPSDPTLLKRVLGKAGAGYLQSVLGPGDRLGVTWGTTLSTVVDFIRPKPIADFSVIQMTGGLTQGIADVNPYDITHQVAERLGGRRYYLYAPVYVDSEETCRALLSDTFIAEVMKRARNATHVLAGLGDLGPQSTFYQIGYVDEATVVHLKEQGAVGDILGRHYDIDGKPAGGRLQNRTVGITLEELRNIPHVIAVAGGGAKVLPILGALRGRLINALITDEFTAREVLQEDGRLVRKGGDGQSRL